MNCTRCEGTGFLNTHQIPEDVVNLETDLIYQWMKQTEGHDVQVCDCCGDGEENWYGDPGEHYGPNDQPGRGGPYEYNGGLCECH